MARASENQYYTVSQAAKMLQISTTTIWRWIQAGKLQAYRVGDKNIRIKKEDLEAVIRPAVAQPKESAPEEAGHKPEPVSEKELARRQALVAKILEASEKRSIAPLTSTDLVRQSRKEAIRRSVRYGRGR